MKTILFRVDGGTHKDIGTGHIYGSILIADQLRDLFTIQFLSLNISGFKYGHNKIVNSGYLLTLVDESNYLNNLSKIVSDISPNFIVCDLYSYSEEILRILKGCNNIPLMTFDHFEAHKSLSDFPINAIAPNSNGKYEGMDYMVIPSSFKKQPFSDAVDRIFVCFGGFDYLNLTKKYMPVFLKVQSNIQITIVVSSIYKTNDLYKSINYQIPSNISIIQQPKDFNSLLGRSQIAILAGGLTLFQALSLGVPSIVICQYEHQLVTVEDFNNHKAYLSLGVGHNVSGNQLEQALEGVIVSAKIRKELYSSSTRFIDGNGLNRCVNLIKRGMLL